jgi:hypothetical protein
MIARSRAFETCGAALLGLLLAVAAAHAQPAPDPASDYISGGVGADEMERINARAKEFNLKLVFTLKEGNYVSDVAVLVKDKAGRTVLAFNAPGPLALARLPRGPYTVEATYDGNTQVRKIDVSSRLRTEYLRWPSNPDTDFPGPKATERD